MALTRAFKNGGNLFKNLFSGYTLIAISNRYKPKAFDLNTVLYWPYYYIIPTIALENKVVYSFARLELQAFYKNTKDYYQLSFSASLGLQAVFL